MPSNTNTVNWSGGAPLANSVYLLALLDGLDPAGVLPYFQVVQNNINAFSVPANTLTSGSHDLLLGITSIANVANASPTSQILLAGCSYIPITVGPGIVAPTITNMSPNSAAAAGTAFTLTVNGTGYSATSVVQWNGVAKATTYVSPTQLTTAITAADIAAAGTAAVTVSNTGAGGGVSTATNFTILAPAPVTLNSLSPTKVPVGSATFVMTATGTGFTSSSVLQWNGVAKVTTYISPTELTAQITAADVAAIGVASVTINNPATPASTAIAVNIVAVSKDAVAFQLNPAHTGVINFNAVTLPPPLKWSVNLGGTPSYALTAAGRVYVTVNVTANTQLSALDQVTGATLWGPVSIAGSTSAAYENNTVFVQSSSGMTGMMQAYDAATGALKWSTVLPTQYSFSSPPTAANGMVFTGGAGSGGTVYAVNQTTGVIVWMQSVANGDSSSPAVSLDAVHVVYPCQTYSFRPSTGKPIWQNNTGCSGGGGATAVVANNVLYAPNGFGIYNGSTFNASSGTLLGSYVSDNPPAIDATRGFFLQTNTLRGITLANNTITWSFAGDGLLNTSPIVVNSGVNSYVFVGSSSGNLYAVDAVTGVQLWTANVGAAIPNGSGWGARMPISSITAGNGLLLVPAGNTLTAYTLSAAP